MYSCRKRKDLTPINLHHQLDEPKGCSVSRVYDTTEGATEGEYEAVYQYIETRRPMVYASLRLDTRYVNANRLHVDTGYENDG